jgi:hypothetical protein
VIRRCLSFVGVVLLVFSASAHAQTYPIQGASCVGVAAAISGTTSGTSVVSPAGGNNLVCISGVWQYPVYQFGSTSAACASGTAGAIQWTGSAFQECNGSNWIGLGSGAATVVLGTSVSVTNPQRSGDATTGFFSPAASTVAVAVGGAEAMRVNSSGFVGIGTATPSANLDVRSTGATQVNIGPIGQGSIELRQDGTAKLFGAGVALQMSSDYGSVQVGGMGGINPPTTSPTFVVQGVASLTASLQQWKNSAGTVLDVVDASGNVGIGTTSPVSMLDVEQTGISNLFRAYSSRGAASLAIDSYGELVYTNVNSMVLGFDNNLSRTALTTGSQDLYLTTDGASGSNNNIILYPNGTGKVGIGTASPQQSLSVVGLNPQVGLNNTGDSVYGYLLDSFDTLYMGTYASTTYYHHFAINHTTGAVGSVTNTGLSNPIFRNVLDDGTGVAYFSGGNVGIGTTSPGQTLSVAGTMSATGILYVNNNGTGTGAGSTGTVQIGDGQVSKTSGGPFTFNSGVNTTALVVSGHTALGTTAYSTNVLDAAGAVAIGGYAGTTGPTNGLIVSGSVGIGTTSPQATLDVSGYARLAKNSSAPATCSSTNVGAIALTHLAQVCVCDTTPQWSVLNTSAACTW